MKACVYKSKEQDPYIHQMHISYISLYIVYNLHIFIFLAPTPLEVFFKLPVSEISEIDDHKSVSKLHYILQR